MRFSAVFAALRPWLGIERNTTGHGEKWISAAKVTRTALQNAASIAGLMITTEAMVAEAPKKDEPAMPPGGMGGMGGMDF